MHFLRWAKGVWRQEDVQFSAFFTHCGIKINTVVGPKDTELSGKAGSDFCRRCHPISWVCSEQIRAGTVVVQVVALDPTGDLEEIE
jgi:hypothetical protein